MMIMNMTVLMLVAIDDADDGSGSANGDAWCPRRAVSAYMPCHQN